MQVESISGVSFKFCRPSGAPARKPSVAMTRALQALSEADEIREFVAEARAQRKGVVVEGFQNRNGLAHGQAGCEELLRWYEFGVTGEVHIGASK